MVPDETGERPSVRVPSKHIIPADAIVINKELGVGEFGVVQQGVWTNEEGERVSKVAGRGRETTVYVKIKEKKNRNWKN